MHTDALSSPAVDQHDRPRDRPYRHALTCMRGRTDMKRRRRWHRLVASELFAVCTGVSYSLSRVSIATHQDLALLFRHVVISRMQDELDKTDACRLLVSNQRGDTRPGFGPRPCRLRALLRAVLGVQEEPPTGETRRDVRPKQSRLR